MACACRCVQQVEKKLAEMNVELDIGIQCDPKTGKMSETGPCVVVQWIGGRKPRGKTLPRLVCTYCPFCGRSISPKKVKRKKAGGE